MTAIEGDMFLCDGLAVLHDEDLVIIDAGWTRIAFSGQTSSQLGALLPALDTKRSVPELASHIGASPQRVAAILNRLGVEGLLDRNRTSSVTSSATRDAKTFYSRNLAMCDKQATASDDVLAILARTEVLIVGPEAFSDALTHDLLGAGIPAAPIAPETLTPERTCRDTRALVVVVHDDERDFEATVNKCLDIGLDVLRVAVGAHGHEIGPVISNGYGPCGSCCELQLVGMSTESVPAHAFAASVTAARLVRQLGGPFDSPQPRELTRTNANQSTEVLEVLPLPGCSRCEPGLHKPGGTAWSYEVSVEAPPPRLISAAEPSKRTLATITRLQTERVERAWSPRLDLDYQPPDTFVAALSQSICPGQSIRVSPPNLDVATVTTLIRYAVGRRSSDSDRRWTPSGGDFGSASLTVLAPEGWCGLPGRAFRYDDRNHQLRAVTRSPGSATFDRLMPSGSVALVVTAAVKRLAGKYGPFALRLAHLDAGCVSLQLALIAQKLGVDLTFQDSWTEDLAELIELNPDEELVTAVLRLRVRPAIDVDAPSSRAGDVFRSLHTRDAQGTPARAQLAHACGSGVTLGEVLERRRSASKDVPTGALTPTQITDVIGTAVAHHRTALATSTDSLTLLVGANRVELRAPGVWSHFLETRVPGPAGTIDGLVDEHLDAAAFVLIGARIAPEIGASDLARLWMSAGALGYSLALAAAQHDLIARPLGGARHEITSYFRQHDPECRHIFSVAIGSKP